MGKTKIIPILFLIIAGVFSVVRAQVLIWFDDMTNFPTNWTTGGTSGPWTKDSNRYKSASYSAKCTPNANYSNNQNNWMERSINLQGFENASVVFSIWQNTEAEDYIYFEYKQSGNWITHWARAGNYGGFDQRVMTNIPNNATAIRFRFFSDSSGTAEGVYIDDVSVYGYRYDVGCVQIIAPTGIVDSGQVITPQAVVINFGDFISTFYVRMRIGTFYNNAQQVLNLPPGQSRTVNFSNWTARQRGVHTVRCSTEHPNDINRANDRALGSVEVRVRNVGTQAIVAPTGTIDSGQVITPRAEIRNYGTTPETFNVFFWIGSNYTSSRTITLNPGVSETTNFDPWIALPRGTITTKCSTALVGDMKPDDDRKTGSVTVRVRDVGVLTINAPTGYVDSTISLVPQATIQNYGTHQENLSVLFRITGQTNWTTTANVTNLNPGEIRTINFNPWTIGSRGNYTTRCSCALVGDQVVFNNFKDSSFVVRVHDVGVVSIASPPGSVDSGTVVPVSASIQNFGSETETFIVQFRIGNFYTSNRPLTLNPGQFTQVNFDDWVVNQPRNNYAFKCTTCLMGDANPSNNQKTGSTQVNVHDVAVVTINSPVSQVDTNSVVPVSALVANYGTYPETFSVIFRIGTFYISTRQVTLNPTDSTIVNFDAWQVFQPRGSYPTKCSTSLSSDANPNNDQIQGSVSVMVHDVGVVEFNSPPSMVDTNATFLVSATIANYGTYNETFNVTYKIGDFYFCTRQVTIGQNSSQLVVFDTWQVFQPRGTYSRQCTTLLINDVNPNNNRIQDSITITVSDVGVVDFFDLPALIDSGGVSVIKALVANFGTQPENFDVQCIIQPNYTSTRNLTLTPGETTLVTFDTWVAQVRNTNLVQCSTQLNDANPLNNTKIESVFVVVRDIALKAIVAPAETVTLNQNITPKTQVENLGNQLTQALVWFKIKRRFAVIYFDSVIVNLEPDEQIIVEFSPWRPESLGVYWLEAYAVFDLDMNPTNNGKLGSTMVKPYVAWFEKAQLPLAGGKKVKQGGSLVYVPESTIYALKGSNTNEFFRYSVAKDTWFAACSIPYGIKPKRVKEGAALTYGQGFVYCVKGNNTLEFWRYKPESDSWYARKPVPAGPNMKRVKGGGGLAFITKGDTNFVYCLKGSKTNEFYAYWVENDSWLARKPIILTPSGKAIGKGSSMTYDPLTNTIFVLKARTNEFYAYDVTSDSWQVKAMMPFIGTMNKKKKVKGGSALVSDGAGLIYAFKGGNTDEFWAYGIAEDTWLTKEPIPPGLNKKRVKAGGSLAIARNIGQIYAFKGGNTNEFWMYKMSPNSLDQKLPKVEGVMNTDTEFRILNSELKILPNPANARVTIEYELACPTDLVLKLYNPCGELVQVMIHRNDAKTGRIVLDTKTLPVGVYLLRLKGRNTNQTKKLIINR